MTTTRTWTAEDLWHLPSDGMRHELVDGEIRSMAPAGGEHGGIIMHFGARLTVFVEDHGLGVVMGPDTGFILSKAGDTVRCPDFSFIAADRIPTSGVPTKFWQQVPDLACEVVSPSDTLFEVEEKIHQYLDAGVRLVWLISPKQRTVTIYRPGPLVRVLGVGDVIDGEDVVPGFSFPVQKIFTR